MCLLAIKNPEGGFNLFNLSDNQFLSFQGGASGVVYENCLGRHLTCKSGVLGSIPGLATYFRFSFRFFKKGSCQLLAEVCARSTG